GFLSLLSSAKGNQTIEVTDWPVASGESRSVTFERSEVYAAGAKIPLGQNLGRAAGQPAAADYLIE
ncbi:MAG: hypothetical protein ABI564_08235, partial [Ideonella sp.]